MNGSWSPQFLARSIGILLLISIVFGAFGEMYVPDTLIAAHDARATANSVLHHQTFFRLGLAAYTVEGVCDAALTALLYVLLRPAGRELALVALLLRIVSTAAFAASEFFYFAALSALRADYLTAFPHEQVNALALLLLRLYGTSGSIPTLFYGMALILIGRLVFVSGYLPRWLGVLLALGGLSTAAGMLVIIIAPQYASSYLLLPMMVAMLAMTLWLLFVGVNVPNWQKRTLSTPPQLVGA
jgi:Domain of unknown function (DUF4386)